MTEREIIRKNRRGEYSLQHNWKVRVSSPRELSWEIHQYLLQNDYEFNEPYRPLELQKAPIEGAATFSSKIEGHKDYPGVSLWRLLVGLFLLLTIVFIPIGIWLIKKYKHVLSEVVCIKIEGEAYRASARSQEPHRPESEVIDLASNARITLDARLTLTRNNKVKEVKNEQEWERLSTEFSQLQDEMDKLIPNISLPFAEDMTKKDGV